MVPWILRRKKEWFIGIPSCSDGRESACNAGDPGSIPGLGKCPREGNGHPLQYSCLENPMDRGIVHGVSMGSRRVGYDWVANTWLFHWILQDTFIWSLNLIYRVRWTVLGGGFPWPLADNLGWCLWVHHHTQLCLPHVPVVHTQLTTLEWSGVSVSEHQPGVKQEATMGWASATDMGSRQFQQEINEGRRLPWWLRP